MSDNPTHAFFAPDGEIQFVYPGGYDDASLVELADDHWDSLKTWNGSAFVEDVAGVAAVKWASVKAKREIIETGGCPTPLGVMDTSAASQGKLNGAVTMALVSQSIGAPFSVEWTMADNSVVAHNASAIITAGMAVGQHVAACHAVATALRAEIGAATTVADLNAVDVDGAAWPSNG
jgi:hypothetical protein